MKEIALFSNVFPAPTVSLFHARALQRDTHRHVVIRFTVSVPPRRAIFSYAFLLSWYVLSLPRCERASSNHEEHVYEFVRVDSGGRYITRFLMKDAN